MKKIFSAVAASLLVLLPVLSDARIVGTAPANPDAWCVNGSNGHVGGSITGAEVCVDASGNMVPTVTGAQALGSSSLAFSAAYIGATGITNAGPTTTGLLTLTRTSVTLLTATQIPLTTSFENLVSNGSGPITLTATPTIPTAGIVSGTIIVLSTVGTIPFRIQDAGTLAGSGVQVASPSYRQIGQYQTLALIYDGADGFWRELAYGAN